MTAPAQNDLDAVARSRVAKQYLGRTLNTMRCFRPLTAKDRKSIESMRLRVVTAIPGENLAELGRRTDNAWDTALTGLYNRIFVSHRFAGGELVKIARIEPYVSGAN